MLSKIINFLNTFNLKPGFTAPQLLPGDFLDTRGRTEKTTIRTLRKQPEQKALTQQALNV
ncbi:hypothetical protein NFJ59_17110 [Citrobacter freundii]|uniref:hypothetical protein n=1 Tax=Citrobacter freundii TaxID=546 RepID=UPI0015F472DB|nr:hypothetical protein [Citrobacter freundii]MBA7802569.1 hypothetical protein [Citrobacter freundii]WFW12110.1 hypothetical protein NFJ59_17110 [Citrobacter freundii]